MDWRLLPVSLLLACASAPPPPPAPLPVPRPSPSGEVYGVGGLAIEDGKPIPSQPGVNVQPAGGLVVAPPPGVVVAPATPPRERLALTKITLGGSTIHRGDRKAVWVFYTAPAGLSVTLQARADTGQSVDRAIGRARYGAVGVALPCDDRPRHVVHWKLTLRDDASGETGNTLAVGILCDGEAPDPPTVAIDVPDRIGAGETARGVARIAGAHPPFELNAHGVSAVQGYNWLCSVDGRKPELAFQIGCRAGKPAHEVRWQFVVRDAQGQTTSVTKVITCAAAP